MYLDFYYYYFHHHYYYHHLTHYHYYVIRLLLINNSNQLPNLDVSQNYCTVWYHLEKNRSTSIATNTYLCLYYLICCNSGMYV